MNRAWLVSSTRTEIANAVSYAEGSLMMQKALAPAAVACAEQVLRAAKVDQQQLTDWSQSTDHPVADAISERILYDLAARYGVTS